MSEKYTLLADYPSSSSTMFPIMFHCETFHTCGYYLIMLVCRASRGAQSTELVSLIHWILDFKQLLLLIIILLVRYQHPRTGFIYCVEVTEYSNSWRSAVYPLSAGDPKEKI